MFPLILPVLPTHLKQHKSKHVNLFDQVPQPLKHQYGLQPFPPSLFAITVAFSTLAKSKNW